MKKNENGFSVVEVVLVVAVLGLLGLVGWLVWSKQQDSKANVASDSKKEMSQKVDTRDTKSTDPYANWQTASFERVEASFKYPKSLKMSHDLNSDAPSNIGFETYTLEASDKTVITLTAFHFMGGFSGDEPKYLIEDVITSKTKANNREFSSIIYKNSNAEYESAYIVDSTQTKYKAGEEKQIFLNAFSVKPTGSNKGSSKIGIEIRGQKYQTFKTLADIKSMEAYKDIQLFVDSLNVPSGE